MTRIFTDGAEMGDLLAISGYSGTGIASGVGQSGAYAYSLGNSGWITKYVPSCTEIYMRARVYFKSPDWANRINVIRYGGQDLVLLELANPQYQLTAKVTNIGTVASSGKNCTSAWYLIETHYVLDNSVGRIEVKLDGIKVIDYTGDTIGTAYSTIDGVLWMGYYNGMYVDDIAINDTNGTEDNSWCGDGYIIKLTPSGSGTDNNWLNSGSVSGSANYLYVDEYPADTTTYTYASASAIGLQTQFSLSNFSVPGAKITRIYPEIRVRKLSANDYGLKIGLLTSGSGDIMSGSMVFTHGDGFARVIGSEIKTNPVTSASWTTAELNDLELIVEIP